MQPRKVRIVADEIRGKSAQYAAALLRYHSSKGARELRKVLLSAIANAQENNNLSPESLRIATIMVDEGPRLKRIQARAMGRANRIVKKSSHITVVVEEFEAARAIKPHGTKAKPRPTFAAPKSGKKRGKAEEAAAKPEPTPTDTDAESVETASVVETAAPADETAIESVDQAAETAQPEEATPVTESDAPEEAGSAEPVQEQEETTEQAEGATGEAEASKEKGAE